MAENKRQRIVVGDRVTVEDPPTGVAMHEEGVVTEVWDNGCVVVRSKRVGVVMHPYDLSIQPRSVPRDAQTT